jgi:hypothetical protein
MAANAIACAACSLPVPAEFWNLEEGTRCRGCGHNLRAFVFPAIAQVRVGTVPEVLRGETEASCFYHAQSRATVVCEDCGRFLCALCDLEVEGRHICPRCFETGVSAHKIQTGEPRRMLYDSIALAISTLPALLFWPALVGAPWTLFIVFRHWNDPGSVVPRTRVRYVLAALIAMAEIGVVIFFIYMILQVSTHQVHEVPSPSVI